HVAPVQRPRGSGKVWRGALPAAVRRDNDAVAATVREVSAGGTIHAVYDGRPGARYHRRVGQDSSRRDPPEATHRDPPEVAGAETSGGAVRRGTAGRAVH